MKPAPVNIVLGRPLTQLPAPFTLPGTISTPIRRPLNPNYSFEAVD